MAEQNELQQVREAYARMEKVFAEFTFAVDDLMQMIDPIVGGLKRKADEGKRINILLEVPKILQSISSENVDLAGNALERIAPVLRQYKPFFEKKYERNGVGSGSDRPA